MKHLKTLVAMLLLTLLTGAKVETKPPTTFRVTVAYYNHYLDPLPSSVSCFTVTYTATSITWVVDHGNACGNGSIGTYNTNHSGFHPARGEGELVNQLIAMYEGRPYIYEE